MGFQITKAAILGAGRRGYRFAALLAGAGIPVTLFRLGQEDRPTDNWLNQRLYTPEMHGYIQESELREQAGALCRYDWVIDAGEPSDQSETGALVLVSEHINTQAILSLCVQERPAADISRLLPAGLRPRFLGIYPFERAQACTFIEIACTPDTDPEAVRFMRRFIHDRLGRDTAAVKDTPGLICRRVGYFSVCSLLNLAEQWRFPCEQVDALTGTMLGRPRGGLYHGMDAEGPAHMVCCIDSLSAHLPAREAVYFSVPGTVRAMLDGNTSAASFYQKQAAGGGQSLLVWDASKREYIPARGGKSEFYVQAMSHKRLKDRLNYIFDSNTPESAFLWEHIKSLLLYCAQLIPDAAGSYEQVDFALQKGLGWSIGPFALWDMLGIQRVAARMLQEGDVLPQWVESLLRENETFYPAADLQPKEPYPILQTLTHSVLVDLADGVLGLDIRSPGNSITQGLRLDILKAIDFLEQDNRFSGMILFNRGPHFLTGTDVKAFYAQLQEKRYSEVDQSTIEFQTVSQRLKYASKPIISAVHGVALGGGAEFVMHSSRVVAHADSQIGLIETRVGIMPGGGGIKELLTRAMQTARHYQLIDPYPLLEKYWLAICQARISKNAFEAREMDYLLPSDVIVMHMDELLPAAKQEVLRMAKLGFRPSAAQDIPVSGREGYNRFCRKIRELRESGVFTQFDGIVAEKVAAAFVGGDRPSGTRLTEKDILALEQRGIQFLYRTDKTFQRVAYAAQGRVLRN